MPGRRKRVSAEDVAREAGVSRTTVSFVLNNTPGKGITESTRERVLDAAEKLGYEPDENARRLARSRSRSIGILVCHSQLVYSDVFITRVLEGMSQVANRYRAYLTLQPVSIGERSYVELAEEHDFDGVVLINARDEDPALARIAAERFPAVSMDEIGDIPVDQVFVDNTVAAKRVTTYLVGLGHRRIGMIAHAPPGFFSVQMRLRGYRAALERAGIPYEEDIIRFGDFSERSGYAEAMDLLRERDSLTAIFAGNDVMAYGVYRAAADLGLSIPDDISVAGFDDDYMSRFLGPPLTTMSLPATGYGAAAIEMLMDRMSDSSVPPRRRVLKVHLAVRESCVGPK